ncbi:MAG: SDR family oxidoreductase [Pirellulales bacterium]
MRVALITGSGKQRVGRAIAEDLAGRGYALALHYRTSCADAEEAAAAFALQGIVARAYPADLAKEQDVLELVAHVKRDFGRIDGLVNAAAIWKKIPLEQTTAADVREHFDTNTLGTFLMCRAVGLEMIAQASGGAIVNIGDWAEIRPYLDYSAYFPSKGGVTALTRAMAVELGTRNPRVRVNCVLPGPVMLPPDLPEAERRAAIDATLVKREGNPRNVALAVAHFLENDFVTGACLPVDGGRSVYAPGD